jgi:hypothetical protein
MAGFHMSGILLQGVEKIMVFSKRKVIRFVFGESIVLLRCRKNSGFSRCNMIEGN